MKSDRELKLGAMEELIKLYHRICAPAVINSKDYNSKTQEQKHQIAQIAQNEIGDEAVEVLEILFRQILAFSKDFSIPGLYIERLKDPRRLDSHTEIEYKKAIEDLYNEAISKMKKTFMLIKDEWNFQRFMSKFLEGAVNLEKLKIADLILRVNKTISDMFPTESFYPSSIGYFDFYISFSLLNFYMQKNIFEEISLEKAQMKKINEASFSVIYKENLTELYSYVLDAAIRENNRDFYEDFFLQKLLSAEDIRSVLNGIDYSSSIEKFLGMIDYLFEKEIFNKDDKKLMEKLLYRPTHNQIPKVLDYMFAKKILNKENKDLTKKYFLAAIRYGRKDLIIYFIENKIVDQNDKTLMKKAFLKFFKKDYKFTHYMVISKEKIRYGKDIKIINYFISNKLVEFSERWFCEKFEEIFYRHDECLKFEKSSIITYFIEKKLVKINKELIQEFFLQAVRLGSEELINYLASEDHFGAERARISVPNKMGETFVHLAQYIKNDKLVVKYLKNFESDVFFQKDNRGMKAIHHAAISGCPKRYKEMADCFDYDIKKNEVYEIVKTGPDQLRMIHYAAMAPRKDMMIYLIEEDTNVNEKELINQLDNKGRSPLHHAVLAKRLENVMFLCSFQATKVNIKDNQGKTPLDVAKELGEEGEYIVGYLEINLRKREKNKVEDISEAQNFVSLPYIDCTKQGIFR